MLHKYTRKFFESESSETPAQKFKVLIVTALGDPEDAWNIDGVPMRFDSIEEAEAEIKEFLEDAEDAGLEYSREDFVIEPA